MKKLLIVLFLALVAASNGYSQDTALVAVPDEEVISADATLAKENVEDKLTGELEETREHAQEEKLDLKETIFEHLGDGYGWEVPFNHHKRIPLPVIVVASDGLHVFSSSKLHKGEEFVDGNAVFKLADSGDYKGKVVEIVDGKEIKPWDFSVTKNVAAIIIGCAVVLLLCLSLARFEKKNPYRTPRGVNGAFEALVEFIYNGVIKGTLKEDAPRFAPYLLTVFMFIFFMNLLGLIVVFPGGANVTGNIAVTMVLALLTFFITNFAGTKVYWKEILWPDVPLWLKCPLPIMQIIEIFGIFTKPAALTVRLFANMMGGHMIVLVLTLLIFIFGAMGVAVASGTAVISILFSVFMLLVDVLVSFIQAYVFTMLSTIFISLAVVKEEHGHGGHAKKEGEDDSNSTHPVPASGSR